MTEPIAPVSPVAPNYAEQLATEGRKWGEHLQVEASGEWHAWLDHPAINAHYRRRALIGGLPWERWVIHYLGEPVARSLDLGCGSGFKSFGVYDAGASRSIEGVDASAERVAEAERWREAAGIPGHFWTGDANALELERARYDLIFSCHSFHHFTELERIVAQVHEALTPRGLFILEEYVGPTRFQWTRRQSLATELLLRSLPAEFRRLRWGAIKEREGRPSVDEVIAVSPFESIRSADIVPLFRRQFDVVARRSLGGTVQHLLYNGIVHNFRPDDPRARRHVRRIWRWEDRLMALGVLPSDFMLLVGRRQA